jgi:transcriptional regulator with XRE-family HTH domain
VRFIPGCSRWNGGETKEGVAKIILKEILKTKRLSKRQLSIRMGIPYQQVFRYFRKGWNPTLKTLERIAKALDLRVVDLIRD